MQTQISTRKRRWRKPTRKVAAIVLCILCLCSVPVFAQSSTTSSSPKTLSEILQMFLSFASRGWVVLATLAGKLMTNDRVYGSALHMDIYLWKLWNIMKNFANFGLAGVVLRTIVQSITGKKGADVKKIITKTLIAGVLIQASRFLVGALVDLSTVAVSAVASFPAAFIQGNTSLNAQITDSVNKEMKGTDYIVDFAPAADKPISSTPNTDPSLSSNDALASILPNSNSISGPLVYLGMSVFRFYEYFNASDSESPVLQNTAINFSLKTIVLLFYTLGLLLLFVANLIRVVFLRFFIIAAPFIVLLWVFKEGDKAEGMMKYLNFKSLIGMIFKPVIYIAMLSLILVFITTIQGVMYGTAIPSLNGVSMTNDNTGSTLAIQDLSSVKINSNMFSDVKTIGSTAKNGFADIIIFLLTIFLTWELVKFAVKGEGPVESVIKPMTDFIQGAAKTMPIFGGFGLNAINAMRKKSTTEFAKGLGLGENRQTGKLKNDADFENRFNRALGMLGRRTDADMTALDKAISTGGMTFWDETYKKAAEISGGLSIDSYSGAWKTRLERWLTTESGHLKTKYGFKDESFSTFETFFGTTDTEPTGKQAQNRRALHNLMMGKDIKNSENKTAWSWGNTKKAPTYTELAANTYFGKGKE